MFKQIKTRLSHINTHESNYIIIDFKRVEVIDSTGMLSFRKLKNLLTISQTHLVITAPCPTIYQQLEKGGLFSSHPLIHYFSNLNSGIEWCEKRLLKQTENPYHRPLSLTDYLSEICSEKIDISQLLSYLEPIEIMPEATIIKGGEPSDHFFLVESGQVKIRGEDPSQGPSFYMNSHTHCRVVGDIDFYLGRIQTAEIVAADQCTVYRVSKKNLKQLEKNNPEIAAILHQVMAILLSERVAHLVKTINTLQQ